LPYYTFPLPAGDAGIYEYTTDLICLDFCRRLTTHKSSLLEQVSTPLAVEAWAKALSRHSDRAFARYICTGLKFGFRIGFSGGTLLHSATENMRSTHEHPSVVSDYLQKELALGRMLGPFNDASHLPPLQINRFGVIPKGHTGDKW